MPTNRMSANRVQNSSRQRGLLNRPSPDCRSVCRLHRVWSSRCKSLLNCWRNLSDPLLQGYGHCVTHILPDRLASVCAYRKFMRAITHSHERAPKRVAIDFAADTLRRKLPLLYRRHHRRKVSKQKTNRALVIISKSKTTLVARTSNKAP